MPILADALLIFELWVCGADDFGDSCERMETLHLGLGSERKNGSAVLNCPVFGFLGRPGTLYRCLYLGHSESRIAKTFRRSFLGRRSDGGVGG